ncbi:MAG: response regulator [Candidatus Hydrogenedens sp.]|nr:response regulator [Candidatus Hydrogenedens sp.]
MEANALAECDDRRSPVWMRRGVKLKLAVFLVLALAAFQGYAEKDAVVLQLKWDHEFQFAGYYAALWQGYYDDAGIDVEIRPRVQPDGSLVTVVDEVVSGRADFGIGSTDILLARGTGSPLVVVSSVFQESPYVIVSLPDSGIRRPSDLAGRTMCYEGTGIHVVELDTLLVNEGIAPASVERVTYRPDLKSLLSGACDATITYDLTAAWLAKEQDVEINVMRPSDFNMLFYGDTLFTHRRLVQTNPGLVERFRSASLRGWAYALENSEEIASRISVELPRVLKLEDVQGYNLEEAEAVRRWMRYPEVAIGTTNPWRWNGIYGQMRDAGLVASDASLSDLVFDYSQITRSTRARQTRTTFSIVALAALSLLVLFLFTRARLWILPVLAVLLLLSGIYMLDQFQRGLQTERTRLRVAEQAGALRVHIEGSIQTTVQLLSGMARLIGAHGELNDDEFALLSAGLLKGSPSISHFAAAPDFVVRHIYPLAGNEAAIGLDYRTDPEQSAAAMMAVEAGEPVVAGPLTLKQGGRGLVARVPVYDATAPLVEGAPKVWGLLAAVIDLDALLQQAGLSDFNQDFELALRGTDGLGEYGDVFYGSTALFEDEPVLQDISVASGTWQLAMAPAGGWENVLLPNTTLWLTGLVFTALVGLMIVFSQRSTRLASISAIALQESEARLARAQNLAKVFTARYTTRDRVLALSPELNALLGFPGNDGTLTFQDALELVDPACRADGIAMVEAVRKGARKVEGICQVHRADGEGTRHLSVIAELSPERPDEVFVTVQDVTERVEAQIALRDSEERFSLAMQGTNDGIWDHDIVRQRVYVSPGWLRMMGYGEDEAERFASPGVAMELVHPEDKERSRQALIRALKSGDATYEIEARVLRSDGKVLDVLSRGHVVRDSTGRALRLVGVNTNFTALREAEREKQRLENQLLQAQKMEALGLLTGGIAHDFNNVLASVMGFTDLAARTLEEISGEQAAQARGHLAEVTRASERARDLVRQLLSFSRPESGAALPVRPATVVDELLRMLRASVPSSIEIRATEIDSECCVLADPVHLHQMLMNLMINARDAVEPAGTVEISVRRDQADDWECASCHEVFSGRFVLITVRDTGPGFSPEALDRVFEPFYTTKPSGRGSGMGLSVVHGIVHGMHGHVCIESEPGAGAVVRLALPAAAAQEPAATIAQEDTPPAATGEVEVLVVDDEPAVAGFVAEALMGSGYSPTVCSNGLEAREAFDAAPRRFSLVITDETMPHLTGSALSRHIRSARADLPIILMSGYSESLDASRAAEAGVTIYLSKPVSLKQLLSAVREVLASARPDGAA